MSTREGSEAQQQPSAPTDPQTHTLLDLLAATPWLLKQVFADSINLLETEGRLALRSLLLIVVLTLCLTGLIAGSWLVLIALVVYTAVETGVPAWGIASGILVLHILAFAGVAQQMKTLARYLFFPNSRRAFRTLLSRDQPPHT
jgi:hypothetical protein